MKKQELQVFQNIQRIQQKQGMLLEKVKSPQQQILHLCGQRYLLSKKMMHKNIDAVLAYLPGTFANIALNSTYLSVCLEMSIELNPEENPLIRKLIEWTDAYPLLKNQSSSSLMGAILPQGNTNAFASYESFLLFLNFIGADLVKLVKRSKAEKSDLNAGEKIQASNFVEIDADDLLTFLMNVLPKTLFNIILPNDVLPQQYKKAHTNMEILYSVPSLQCFLKTKTHLAATIKIFVRLLLKIEMKPGQQRAMMEIVFRYFYAYHNDKKFGATDIFIEAYNILSETTRFSLADDFVLFLKVISKIGKQKFVDFLIQKSPWLKEVYEKVSDKNQVGYAKEQLIPFPQLRICDNISVPSGKTATRTFEVFQDYSLFYFNVEVASYDITLKLYYLGGITDSKTSKTLLLTQEKSSGSFKTSIMAARKGLYQFQFDNSYSWMNSKTVKFQRIVLSPVQFESQDDPKWISSYFDNVVFNEFADKSKIYRIQKPKPQQKKERVVDSKFEANANITKLGAFFNMKITRGNNVYEFESQNEDKFVKKFNQIIAKGTNIKWTVAGQPLDDVQSLPQQMTAIHKNNQKQLKKQNSSQKSTNVEVVSSRKEELKAEPSTQVVEKEQKKAQVKKEEQIQKFQEKEVDEQKQREEKKETVPDASQE